MKNPPFKLFSETIQRGERASLALPLPELFSCAPMYMPIKVVHGKQAGPCILITAAMHGDEVNGTEIINRLLKHSALNKLRGTLIAVPIMNVYGFVNRSRFMPNGIELDRSFPGSETGSHAARLTHLFTSEILPKATHCIDLQTGRQNHSNVPMVFGNLEDYTTKAMAEAFKSPVIANTVITPGSYREACHQQSKPLLVYEAGEALRFDEYAIKVGLKGVLNVMRSLEMLPATKNSSPAGPPQKSFYTQENHWERAPISGVSHSNIQLGTLVQQGDLLAVVSDPFGNNEPVKIHASEEGIVVGINNLPLVHEGETLFQLALFKRMEMAADHLENWQQSTTEPPVKE